MINVEDIEEAAWLAGFLAVLPPVTRTLFAYVIPTERHRVLREPALSEAEGEREGRDLVLLSPEQDDD